MGHEKGPRPGAPDPTSTSNDDAHKPPRSKMTRPKSDLKSNGDDRTARLRERLKNTGKRSPATAATPEAPPPPPVPPAVPSAASDEGDQPQRKARKSKKATPPPPPLPVQGAKDPLGKAAEQLVAQCQSELDADPSDERAARLHYEAARLLEVPLQRFSEAAAHYRQALALNAEHLPSIRGARRTLINAGQHRSALALFDAEIRITSDARAKAALHFRRGRLLEDVLDAPDEAREAYATAHELDKTSPTYLKALEQCDLETEQWDSLILTLEQAANAVAGDPRHRAALVAMRARLLEGKLGEAEDAAELHEMALRLDPEAPGALEALKRLHHQHQRWRDLIDVLGREADGTTDQRVRTMALYRIAVLHERRLGNQREAIAALEKASEVSPEDTLVLEELARLYDASKRYDELLSVLERLTAAKKDTDEKLDLMHRIGQLAELTLHDPDGAKRWYQAALELDPGYLPALQALGNLYTKQGEHKALMQMLLREAETVKEAKRRAVAFARAAELAETHLSDRDFAIHHHGRALALMPTYEASFRALTRLYSETSQHRSLVELYERQLDHLEDAETAISYLFKIGALYEDQLEEPANAGHAYKRILERRPDHLHAVHALQRAWERAGRWQDLVAALELEVGKIEDKGQIVGLLHRAGDVLFDKLQDYDGALKRLRRVIELDPAYRPALSSLGRLYYRLGRWDDLLGVYAREMEVEPQGEAAVARLHKMAELCEHQIGNVESAIEHYKKAIELDLEYGPSLRALARLLRSRQSWAELVDILELQLLSLKDPQAKALTAFRIGVLSEEKLGYRERAMQAYENALKAMPGYRPAVDALTRLRTERQSWQALAMGLAAEAKETSDERLKLATIMRQGSVWRDEEKDAKKAIVCFKMVLKADPDHLGAMLELEALYRETEAWEDLAEIYRGQARVLVDTGAKIAALRELARVEATHGVGDAVGTYHQILELSSEDPVALAALESLGILRTDRQLLMNVDVKLADTAVADPTLLADYRVRLAESYEASGDERALATYRDALISDPESLAATWGMMRVAEAKGDVEVMSDALRKLAALTTAPAESAELLVKTAELRRKHLEDDAGAISLLERALEVYPDSVSACDMLTTILIRLGEVARLTDVFSRAASSAASSERRVALWTLVAQHLDEGMGNRGGAIAALRRVLKEEPDNARTLRRLAHLYEAEGQWNEAAANLEKVLDHSDSDETRRQVRLELAQIYHEALRDPKRAGEHLEIVLKETPSDMRALARMMEIQAESGDREGAAETGRRLLERAKEPAERAGLLTRIGRMEATQGKRAAAAASYRKAISLAGPEGQAAQGYRELIGQAVTDEGEAASWSGYVAALRSFLESEQGRTAASSGAASDIYLELARVQAKELGDEAAAVKTLREGVQRAPSEPRLRTELANTLLAGGQVDVALQELWRVLESDITAADTWRSVSAAMQKVGRVDDSRLAYASLVVLGEATDAESAIVDLTSGVADARPGALTADLLRQLGEEPAAFKPAEELLAGAVEGIGKVMPPLLADYGVSGRDRISGRGSSAVQQAVEQVARFFPLEEFDLYVHGSRSLGVRAVHTSPPALLVPGTLPQLEAREQRFLLGRALAKLSRNLAPLDAMPVEDVQRLLAATARVGVSNYGAELPDQAGLDDLSKRLSKALSRRTRKGVEKLAGTFAATSGRVAVDRWVEAVEVSATRAGLLLANDLPFTVRLLQSRDASLAGLSVPAAVAASPMLQRLMLFWPSDRARAVRDAAGIVKGR